MKKFLYNAAIIKPFITILIIIITVFSLFFILNNSYVYEFAETSGAIDFNIEAPFAIIRFENVNSISIFEGDDILIYGNINERLYEASVIGVSENQSNIQITLLLLKKDYELLKAKYDSQNIIIRKNTHRVKLWDKSFR